MVRCTRVRVMGVVAMWAGNRLGLLAGAAGAAILAVLAALVGAPRVPALPGRVAWAAPTVLVERRCDAALAWRTQLTLADINLAWRAGEGDQREARPVLQRYLFQAQNEIMRYCGE
jgi:hypothetical protein